MILTRIICENKINKNTAKYTVSRNFSRIAQELKTSSHRQFCSCKRFATPAAAAALRALNSIAHLGILSNCHFLTHSSLTIDQKRHYLTRMWSENNGNGYKHYQSSQYQQRPFQRLPLSANARPFCTATKPIKQRKQQRNKQYQNNGDNNANSGDEIREEDILPRQELITFVSKFMPVSRHESSKELETHGTSIKKLEAHFGTPQVKKHKFGFLAFLKVKDPSGNETVCVGFSGQKKKHAQCLALFHVHKTIQAFSTTQFGGTQVQIAPLMFKTEVDNVLGNLPTISKQTTFINDPLSGASAIDIPKTETEIAAAKLAEYQRQLHFYLQEEYPTLGDEIFDEAASLIKQYEGDDEQGLRDLFQKLSKSNKKPKYVSITGAHLDRKSNVVRMLRNQSSKTVVYRNQVSIAYMKVPEYKKYPAVGIGTNHRMARHRCYIQAVLIHRIASVKNLGKDGKIDMTNVQQEMQGLLDFFIKSTGAQVSMSKINEGLNRSGMHRSRVTIGCTTCTGEGPNELEAHKNAVARCADVMSTTDHAFMLLNKIARKYKDAEIAGNAPCVSIPPTMITRIHEEYRSLPTTSVQVLLAPQHIPQSINESLEEIARLRKISDKMRAERQLTYQNPVYQENIEPIRLKLPIFQRHDQILSTIKHNQVTIITASTGSGKTTQVPQYILDSLIEENEGANCKIYVTQPRRISAVSIAERIAQERIQKIEDDVGYCIRLDQRPGKRITLVTTGVLLAFLVGDPLLSGVTHLFIDECHERQVDCDVVLSFLKNLCEKRPDLRVILMSATMEAKLFTTYFGNAAVIDVEGRMFPVRSTNLDQLELRLNGESDERAMTDLHCLRNYKNIILKNIFKPQYIKIDPQMVAVALRRAIAMEAVDRENSVLIFCPGWGDINAAEMACNADAPGKYHIIKLHSSVSMQVQHQAFEPSPYGKTKVIIATNIAESGITINGVAIVIDMAMSYLTYWTRKTGDSFVTELRKSFASRASMKQRRGRAGRTQNGKYFCMLPEQVLPDIPEHYLPEICRVPLSTVMLRLLGIGVIDPESQLEKFIEPPPRVHVKESIRELKSLGAISFSDDEKFVKSVDEANLNRNQDDLKNQLKMASNERSKLLEVQSLSSTNPQLPQLTLLGHILAKIPVDPMRGKILLTSFMLGCLESGMTAVATTELDPFITNREMKKEVRFARQAFGMDVNSDHLAMVNAVHSYIVDPTLANTYPLDRNSCSRILRYKEQYRGILWRLFGWEDSNVELANAALCGEVSAFENENRNRDNNDFNDKKNSKFNWNARQNAVTVIPSENDAFRVAFLRAAIASGYFNRVALSYRDSEAAFTSTGKKSNSTAVFRTKHQRGVSLGNGSAINHKHPCLPSPFYVTYEGIFVPPAMGRAVKPVFNNATFVTILELVLIAAPPTALNYFPEVNLCLCDEWICFSITSESYQALLQLKTIMEIRMWEKLEQPRSLAVNGGFQRCMRMVQELLICAEKERISGASGAEDMEGEDEDDDDEMDDDWNDEKGDEDDGRDTAVYQPRNERIKNHISNGNNNTQNWYDKVTETMVVDFNKDTPLAVRARIDQSIANASVGNDV